MSRLPPGFLSSIGIDESSQPVPIPLYTRKRVTQVGHHVALPNLVLHQVEDVPLDVQERVRLVLQITDGRKFRRYI